MLLSTHAQNPYLAIFLSSRVLYYFSSKADQIVALDSQTGRILWQRSSTELNCFDYGLTWQTDEQSVYLNCNRYPSSQGQQSSAIVALSAQTGQVQWQTLLSLAQHSRDAPMTIRTGQLLMLDNVNQGKRTQTQVIALDRGTGKILWRFPLPSNRSWFYNARLAGTDHQFFVIASVPQWQLWLWQINPHWYLNRAISEEER
ncbi:MAG: PQQ-binding-like beta-propeller repeat protein [Aphanocapsa sp. GSE-SYN-MK-11-07L]|nr:PQQ-binding-like beta-propeller repeat protein [Aphanocapsa sp. GSE-SYN-MK-11-07L]